MIEPSRILPGERFFEFTMSGVLVNLRLHPVPPDQMKAEFTGPKLDKYHVFCRGAAPGPYWRHPRIQQELQGIATAFAVEEATPEGSVCLEAVEARYMLDQPFNGVLSKVDLGTFQTLRALVAEVRAQRAARSTQAALSIWPCG